MYGLGHAEPVLGRALAAHRGEVVIATKCGLVWDWQLSRDERTAIDVVLRSTPVPSPEGPP